MGWRDQWKSVFAMVFVNFTFAVVNVLFKKVLDRGTNHMVIVTYRFIISAIFLAPISCYLERLTLTQCLFLLGLGYTSTTFSCAFLNTVPVNTFILALPFGLERVNLKKKAGKAKVLGAVICMGGAILLCLYKGVPLKNIDEPTDIPSHVANSNTTQRWIVGSMFLMAACLSFSSWFLLQAKIGKTYPCQYSSTAILTFFAAIQSALISLIFERDLGMWVLKGKLEILSVIYAGVVTSGLCYVIMSWCVKQRGPVFTAAFTPFTQIFAAMFDVSILHDQIYLGSVIGSVLVISGLYILLWGKSNEAEEFTVKQTQLKEDVNGIGDVELQVPVTIKS
ncbi:WAT1-related protein At3g30340-like isoform X2 [Euphorbia lathyris]|uniref:WAT1-related protein At3g30340-like isoform X2 n=1 Tax=Euphorbia lathyris TaxID=212925 RepID=UPI003313E89A